MLVEGVIGEGSGDIRVVYYPSKPHIVTVHVPVPLGCMLEGFPAKIGQLYSLVEHFPTTKHMGICKKNILIQYFSWFDPYMTLTRPWSSYYPSKGQPQPMSPLVLDAQLWVSQLLCDFKPTFHKVIMVMDQIKT